MQDNINPQVRKFIENNYLFGEESTSLKDNDSLRDAGLIDSTGILELVGFLESKFDIQIQDAEIVPDNLDSIAAISSYVSAKQAKGITTASQTVKESLTADRR
jgi:acyl carrier protein